MALTRKDVIAIHAFHDAAFKLALYAVPAVAILFLAAGGAVHLLPAVISATLALGLLVGGTASDLMSMRIPNPMTIALLAAAPLWWAAVLTGSAPPEGAGVGRNIIAALFGQADHGSLLPHLQAASSLKVIAWGIGLSVVLSIPLILSYTLGLGFGGGDVKLMIPFMLFLGWPLGFDFFMLTFFFGAGFSLAFMVVRARARRRRKKGTADADDLRIAAMRHFPYAPAIALSGLLCAGQKLEGLLT